MNGRILTCLGLSIVLPLIFAYRAAQVSVPPNADERLALSTSRPDYLLGEPVVLVLTFSNTSKESLKVVEVFVEPSHYEASIWISANGEAFQEFPRNSVVYKRSRQVFHLQPGDILQYKYRVVVGRLPDAKLAFPAVGEYQMYAAYPLYVAGGPPQSVKIASNVVQVHIKKPTGDDARVWQQLNDPSLLALLQVEAVDKQRQDVPMKLAKLLRSYPASGYAAALRHALSKVYFHHRFGLQQKDQQELAQTLGIADVDALADDRLERRRKDQLPGGTSLVEKQTPLSKVLALLNELGVPLDAPPELGDKKVNIAVAYSPMRLAMRALSDDLEASWERRGNGYSLVPFDASTPKRFNPKADGR